MKSPHAVKAWSEIHHGSGRLGRSSELVDEGLRTGI